MTETRRVVNALILDMDNTLYDWVSYFVPAIHAMLAAASRLLDVSAEELRDDLHAVHVARHNTEHPFALLETRAVTDRLPALTRQQRHDFLIPAFSAFDDVRQHRLRLYPGVYETLKTIKATGCPVLGHTEATDINIVSRARLLRLHGMLDAIYAPRSSGLPHPIGDSCGSRDGRVPVHTLPHALRKPNPSAVQIILADIGVEARLSLYVGDSLAKDVTMAKRAGMLAAWARYGANPDPQLWRDLVELSHWDQAAVAAAKDSLSSPNMHPDVTLGSFQELLQYFSFYGQ